ncbi:tetratricopeptide repeat protein, partial [Chitinimonas sp.]|uniref:tetratricopeptide repeat protein n=1 Tax=Chitinimonas sp. TaxID=1934313 RepID=UPI0035B0C10A
MTSISMTTNRTLPENTKPPRLIDQLAEQASAADSTQYDERAAQQLFNKGMAYFKGVGVKRHDGMALSFWRKAADMGHAEACNAVGYMLELGRGTSKNAAGAVANYRKAAQMLNLNGKYNLGRCYARGIGTEKDEHSAADNLKYAAYRGQTAANIELTQLTGEAGSFLGNLFGNLFIAVILFALGSACLMGGFALNKQDAQRKEIARRLDSEG